MRNNPWNPGKPLRGESSRLFLYKATFSIYPSCPALLVLL